jgi:hypothetical protein
MGLGAVQHGRKLGLSENYVASVITLPYEGSRFVHSTLPGCST